MWEDPIVAEVRKAREQILSRFDNDLAAYVEHLKSFGAKKRARGVRYVEFALGTGPLPVSPTPHHRHHS